MMDPYKNQDYIDAYLKGDLTPEEVQAFEKKMDEDPLLNQEVRYNEDMLKALSSKRKMMLKARLDNVQVGTLAHIGVQKIMGWVASVSSVLLISGGVWYIQSTNNEQPLESAISLGPENVVEQRNESPLPAVPEPAPSNQNITDNNQPDEPASSPEVKEAETNVREESVNQENEDQPARVESEQANALPEVKQPDVLTRFEEDFLNQDNDNIDIPGKDLVSNKALGNNNLQIATIDEEGYEFHYQYYNDRLYLYGDFKNSPYEILALNNEDNDELRLFLAYEGNFYSISHGQKEIRPLIKIEDPELIEELEVVKDHK